MENDLLLVTFEPAPERAGAIPFSAVSSVVVGLEEFLSATISAINAPAGLIASTPRLLLVAEPDRGSIRLKFKVEIDADIQASSLRSVSPERNPGIRDALSMLSDVITVVPFITALAFGSFGLYAQTLGSRSLDQPVEQYDIAADAAAKHVRNGMMNPAEKLKEVAERSGCSSIQVQAPGCAPIELVGQSRRRMGLIGSQFSHGIDDIQKTSELIGYARPDNEQIRVEVDGKEYIAFYARRADTPRRRVGATMLDQPAGPAEVVMVWGSQRDAPQGAVNRLRPVTGNIMVRGKFLSRTTDVTPLDDVPLHYETAPIFFVVSSNSGWN